MERTFLIHIPLIHSRNSIKELYNDNRQYSTILSNDLKLELLKSIQEYIFKEKHTIEIEIVGNSHMVGNYVDPSLKSLFELDVDEVFFNISIIDLNILDKLVLDGLLINNIFILSISYFTKE